MIPTDPHPLLCADGFVARFPAALGTLPSPPALLGALRRDAAAPLPPPDDALRAAVRELLRHGGFKPTGRSKPASEYLRNLAETATLPAINLAVDACNAVSLHSGFPISVVDLDRARPPLRIALAPAGASFVFNAGGQAIDIGGLLCLHDADGPCANAVKDAQRTKTGDATRRTLSVVWGTVRYADRVHATGAWYRALLRENGADVDEP
jgi:DNA/RNA-binding domain of Phe-tRNA-synthetase-like protein